LQAQIEEILRNFEPALENVFLKRKFIASKKNFSVLVVGYFGRNDGQHR